MNKQKEVEIDSKVAMDHLRCKYPEETVHLYENYLEYWAYPEVFGNTAGPFSKPGRISGQAMTTFTIEAWVFDNLAVLFCRDKIVKVTNEWKGPQTVRIK